MKAPWGRDCRQKERRNGLTITEVLVAAAVLAGLAMVVQALSLEASRSIASVRQSATHLSLRGNLVNIHRNIPAWMAIMRSRSPAIQACMPVGTGVTYSCSFPATAQPIDGGVLNIANGRTVSSVPIRDDRDELVAGTQDNPLYLDFDGKACNPAAGSCRFQAQGYIIRQGAAANASPESVSFVVKISASPQSGAAGGERSIQVTYEVIHVGLQWMWGNTGIIPGQCPPDQVVTGVDQLNGLPICAPLAPLTANCPAGQYLAGFNNGVNVCRPLP